MTCSAYLEFRGYALLKRPSSRASVLLVHPGAPCTGSTLAMRMAEGLLRGLLSLRTVSWERILGRGVSLPERGDGTQ